MQRFGSGPDKKSAIELARERFLAGQFDDAHVIVSQILQVHYFDLPATNLLASILSRQGRLTEAFELMKRAVERYPENPGLKLRIREIEAAIGRKSLLDQVNKVLSASEALVAENEYDAAAELLMSAPKPINVFFAKRLWQQLAAVGRIDVARQMMAAWEDLGEDQRLLISAHLLYLSGDVEAGLAIVDQLAESEVANDAIAFAVEWNVTLGRRHRAAERAASLARRLEPPDLVQRAVVLSQTLDLAGQHEPAMQLLRKAHEIASQGIGPAKSAVRISMLLFDLTSAERAALREPDKSKSASLLHQIAFLKQCDEYMQVENAGEKVVHGSGGMSPLRATQ